MKHSKGDARTVFPRRKKYVWMWVERVAEPKAREREEHQAHNAVHFIGADVSPV